MKLVYFDDYRLGAVIGTGIVDVSGELRDLPRRAPEDLMAALIEHFGEYRARIEKAVISGKPIPLAEVKFRVPLPRPHAIVCIAVNYDNGLLKSAHTNAFHKSPSALIGCDETLVLPDVPASVFEGEAEMAVVIGKKATRDLQPATNSFFQMKSRDTFAPIGPYIVTRDEIPDPQNLQIRLWVNGEIKQDFNTRKMITGVGESVAWVSAIQTLMPGDILATGTDHCGLNAFQHGEIVELETEGLGRLRVNVRDDLKRTWSRELRIDRHNKGLSAIAPQLSGKYASMGSKH